jgi:hypothetical protein
MLRSDRARDTGRDVRHAVGSWSHWLPSHRDVKTNFNAGSLRIDGVCLTRTMRVG